MSLALVLNAPIKAEFRRSEQYPGDEPEKKQDAVLDEIEKVLTGTYSKNALLILDASKTESHSLKAEIPTHSIETGAEITDHVYLKPRTISINGVISDSPVVYLSGLFNFGALTNIGGPNELSPSINAYNALVEILNHRRVLDVVTALEYYPNMMITSIGINRTNASGRALEFTANLTEVKFIDMNVKAGAPDDMIDNQKMGDHVTPFFDIGQLAMATYYSGKVLMNALI